MSASVYKKPFSITGPATGWVAETATQPETNSPTLAELTFPTMELYAMPSATQTLLDDSAVNIDEWLAEEIQIAFASQEGAAFVTGDGNNKPRASSTTLMSTTHRGVGAISAMCPPARTGRSMRRTPPTT